MIQQGLVVQWNFCTAPWAPAAETALSASTARAERPRILRVRVIVLPFDWPAGPLPAHQSIPRPVSSVKDSRVSVLGGFRGFTVGRLISCKFEDVGFPRRTDPYQAAPRCQSQRRSGVVDSGAVWLHGEPGGAEGILAEAAGLRGRLILKEIEGIACVSDLFGPVRAPDRAQ